MSIPNSTELQRLRYGQGQMLRSRDFRDQVAIEAQLRWWHNRALHNAFGVVSGLVASPVDGEDPLEAVHVTCGLAYDCFGRQLLLQDAREIRVPGAPAQGGGMILLLRYKESLPSPKGIETSGVCVPCQVSPHQEEPDLLWKPSRRVEVADGVPLAQVRYESGKPSFDTSFMAPHFRALARPHIASGATIAGQTSWTAWKILLGGERKVLGVQVTIDTSSAGFTEVPCYFAWLQGSLWSRNDNRFSVSFGHIDEPSINGFVFRMWMPITSATMTKADGQMSKHFKNNFLSFAQKQGLSVCWVGIQPHRGDSGKTR